MRYLSILDRIRGTVSCCIEYLRPGRRNREDPKLHSIPESVYAHQNFFQYNISQSIAPLNVFQRRLSGQITTEKVMEGFNSLRASFSGDPDHDDTTLSMFFHITYS
jgi:hypothetical protein